MPEPQTAPAAVAPPPPPPSVTAVGTAEPEPRPARGWALPRRARLGHYFTPSGSLCGRWGPTRRALEPTPPPRWAHPAQRIGLCPRCERASGHQPAPPA